jgi:hypothetical protein
MVPRDTGHEFLVQLTHESDGKRKFLEARTTMFESHNVIANFSEILWTSVYHGAGFCGQQLTKSSLRPLDLARQNSLASNERPNQNMRVRQPPPLASEPSYKAVSIRESSN